MPNRHPPLATHAKPRARRPALPQVWLVSDARNDARIDATLARLPRGSGLIFRHYHLCAQQRPVRWQAVARQARRFGHRAILAGTMAEARRAGADGAYGSGKRLMSGGAGLRLVTVHSLRELARAHRIHAARKGPLAILLSPVHTTRSHPGAGHIGPLRWRLIARRSRVPVIALGGMNRHRARALGRFAWAAIDGI